MGRNHPEFRDGINQTRRPERQLSGCVARISPSAEVLLAGMAGGLPAVFVLSYPASWISPRVSAIWFFFLGICWIASFFRFSYLFQQWPCPRCGEIFERSPVDTLQLVCPAMRDMRFEENLRFHRSRNSNGESHQDNSRSIWLQSGLQIIDPEPTDMAHIGHRSFHSRQLREASRSMSAFSASRRRRCALGYAAIFLRSS